MNSGSTNHNNKRSFPLKPVVDAVAANTQTTPNPDRVARFSFHVAVSLFTSEAAGKLAKAGKAWGLDISYTGMAFLTRSKFPPNTRLIIELYPMLGHRIRQELTVIRCTDDVNGMYKIGTRFVRE